ncbi:unnamed protein product, partial [Rotaria magnacalcarata]
LYSECNSQINKQFYALPLPSHRVQSIFSFYDNYVENEDGRSQSKWTIVRRRLPDILALSSTYKPKSVRAQLFLLMALMNRQSSELHQSSDNKSNLELSCAPQSVIINIGGHNRLIHLKLIPPQQMIHVDVDGLTFSIPTRQFIAAISRGDAYQAASKFFPPAITNMLINLSKTKVADDGIQYQRIRLRMRIGKILFFSLFTFIIGMMLILILSTMNILLKMC